jgi:branched-subunit amino acid transport protein
MEPLTLRALERIIAVLVGGLTILLGYKLFMHLPTQTNSEGKVVLPGNISVYLSRVGPGAFFALFGTIVLTASFYFQFKFNPEQRIAAMAPAESKISEAAFSYLTATEGIGDQQAIESARSRVIKDLRTLNRLNTRLNSAVQGDRVLMNENERTDLMLTLPKIKLALLFTVWGKDWGDYASFAKWVKSGADGPAPQGTEKAAAIFREH